jgi:NodT family efflux transporter outer membrane factor (OMF) lipoprotein
MPAPRGKAALAALALLAGCAGPRPAVPPDTQVVPPAAWRTASARPGTEPSATWWDAFGDPGLTRIVAAALADNDDVRIATARVEELMGQAAFARAQRLPELDGTVVYQRDRSINPARGLPQVENVTEPVLAFSFDADLFGRLRAADAAARANLLGTRAAQADVRLLVAATAARDWFTLRSLDERLATLRQTLDARAQTLKLVRRRVSVGYAAQLDLAQAEAEYRATEQQIPATELAIRRTEDALSVLLGRNPGAIDRGEPAIEAPPPSVPAALPSSLLRRRPDIVEAEERVVAADRALDASRAAFMPDLRLSGDWGHVTSTILGNHPVDVFTIGASILAPILDAGRLKAQEDSAAARRDQAAFAYRKATLEAFGQVEDALAATQRLHEQLDSLQAQKSALDKTLQIASQRYKSGYAPFLDQLDAQRGLLSVQLAITQARADELNAYVTLFQALGGGWDRSLLESGDGQGHLDVAPRRI